MQEYLLLLRGGVPMTSKTESENKAEMHAWGSYMHSLAVRGQLLGGLPLVSGGAVVSAREITDEPVVSSTEGVVGGYLVIKAKDLQEAIAIAQSCPHVLNQGNIEVREIGAVPSM